MTDIQIAVVGALACFGGLILLGRVASIKHNSDILLTEYERLLSDAREQQLPRPANNGGTAEPVEVVESVQALDVKPDHLMKPSQ